ncbi:hypothetical protein [Vagococcus fluvialis]|uniref:hypothetical protein n=1 Tax=Vagococcus fluvialis TaxID=2738 RepID=UPI001D0B1746|nr:hypothetical protein [Vagococcus fluvialis]UDM75049.1 hypothetical protein K5K99_05600 [Vagococcus fluvialis]
MEVNYSIIEVVKYYDKLINDCLQAIKATYHVIENTDDEDKTSLRSCNAVLGELELKLEGLLNIRKKAIDQIYKESI